MIFLLNEGREGQVNDSLFTRLDVDEVDLGNDETLLSQTLPHPVSDFPLILVVGWDGHDWCPIYLHGVMDYIASDISWRDI